MATQSVQKDWKSGPDWPLGLIANVAIGTPVGIMSLVDPNAYNDPGTATPAVPGPTLSDEYSIRVYGLIFIACRANTNGLQINQGNIYICRKGVQGLGNRSDYGSIVAVLPPGATTQTRFPTFTLLSAPLNRNTFSPYRYYIDADNTGDGCLVTALIE